MRGDEGPLGNFSIELLEDGFRAIDPVSRLRYLVKRAPEDAALTTTAPLDGPAPSSKGDVPAAKPSPVAAKVETPDPEIPPPPKQRPMAQTMAFSSQGSAMVSEPVKTAPPAPAPAAPTPAPVAAAPTPAPVAAAGGRTRKPAQTIAYSSQGSAAVLEAAAKIETARAAAPAAAAPVAAAPAAAPRPAPAPAAPALPSYTLVNEREDKPSERSPLSYREHVYAVAPGTSEDDVKRLILERFESVRQSLEQARPGKLINLAIFDHVFQGRPQRRPLVTLSWKDWKNEPPELHYPARDGVSVPPPPASAAPAGMSPAAAAPPASAPVAPVSAVAAPQPAAPAKVAPTAPAPASARAPDPVPAPKKAAPAAPVPVATKTAAAPAVAPRPTPASGLRGASAPSSTKTSRAATASTATPRSGPQKRLSGEDLLTELFEAFNDLHFLRDSIEGAEFVLALTLEKLPSEVGLISLFDMNKREFVVVRQTGGNRVVGQRQPEKAPVASSAMRKRHAVVLSKPDEVKAVVDERFQAIGVELRSLVCAPVELGGRYLGLIELLNPLDGSLFNDGDGNALTYIGQQFAEFAASRGVMIDPEQLKESAVAPRSTPASSKRS